MSTEKITLRKDKGSALTYEELDSNFEEYVIFRNKFATVDSSTGIATFPQFSGDNNGKVLYWDNANAKVNVKTLSASDLAAGFGANFNSHLALKTTSDLSEGTNLYYTTARANTDFDSRLATKSTTNLAEGSNLYYTDARVLTKINSTSVRQMQDMPTANVVTDDSKVVTYDATTDSFRYASMLTESLLPVTDHGLITDGNVITGSSGVTTTTLQALTNVNFASVSGAIDGNVLVYDATASEWKAGVVTSSGGIVNTGVTTFGGLSDTPANFTGHAGKYVKVNSGETGVEFDTLTTDDLSEGTSKFYTDSRFDTRLSAKSTDDLTEGSSNFYYTDAKVDGRIALQVGANLNLGSKTTDHLAEGSTNEYYTTFRANTAIDTRFPQKYIYDLKNVDTPLAGDDQNVLFYDHASTRFKWGQLNDTADLPEGTNLYFTNARADARISAASIGALSDVNTSGAANGKILKYNGSAWVIADDASGASSIALTDLSVGAEGSASGDGAIAYDNSTGVFTYTPPDLSTYLTSISSQNLSNLADVNNTSPTDGQALVWDNANSYWKPGTVGGGAGGDITSVTAGTGLTGGGTNGAVTVNVDVGTTANKIMQITADGKLPGVVATDVHKENNKVATAGTIIFDGSSKTHFYINANGNVNIRGSNWQPGVRYCLFIENSSGTTITVTTQRDNGDNLESATLGSGSGMSLYLDSFGTSSDAVTYFSTVGTLGYWNNTTI